MHQLSPLHPNLSMTKDYLILSQDIAKFSNWPLLQIYPLHDIQNTSSASSEPFCDGTWESMPCAPFSGSHWLWRESKFLTVDSKALYCMAPDFDQSFNFPILLRDTLCNPDLYKVPTLHRAISAAHACGHAIPRTRNASSLPLCPPILPDSLLLILWLVKAPGLDRELEAPGLDGELTQQHLPTSRSEISLAASL